MAEVAAWVEPLRGPLGVEQFQLVVSRVDLLDRLTFRLVGRDTRGTAGGEAPELLRSLSPTTSGHASSPSMPGRCTCRLWNG